MYLLDGIMTRLRVGRSGVRIAAGARYFFFVTYSPVLGPAQSPIQWVAWVVSRSKVAGAWSWVSRPSSAEGKNECSHTSAPHIQYMPSWNIYPLQHVWEWIKLNKTSEIRTLSCYEIKGPPPNGPYKNRRCLLSLNGKVHRTWENMAVTLHWRLKFRNRDNSVLFSEVWNTLLGLFGLNSIFNLCVA
jgi:hypothetical protein